MTPTEQTKDYTVPVLLMKCEYLYYFNFVLPVLLDQLVPCLGVHGLSALKELGLSRHQRPGK